MPTIPDSNVIGAFHLLSSGLHPKPIHSHGALVPQDLFAYMLNSQQSLGNVQVMLYKDGKSNAFNVLKQQEMINQYIHMRLVDQGQGVHFQV